MLENFQNMNTDLLLSIINTKLRDFHSSLNDLARTYDIDEDALCKKLASGGYIYYADTNQFKQI